MASPHEETWSAHKDCVVRLADWRTVFVPHEDVGPEPSRERAQLAAQAPAMARLLLALQWSGLQYGDSEPCCPSCHADERAGKHADDCELAAVLRAAGVLS